MKLLVLGATGATGQHLVERALADGHSVTVLVRDPSKVTTRDPNLTVERGQATSFDDLARVVPGVDAVLSTLGPRSGKDTVCPEAADALVKAMKQHGVERVIWLSASGVGDSKDTIVRTSFIFGRIIMPLFLKHPYANHGKAEDTLRASGLKFTVFRPLQLTDKPSGKPTVATLPGDKVGGLKIARQDVAAFMLRELTQNEFVGRMPLLWT